MINEPPALSDRQQRLIEVALAAERARRDRLVRWQVLRNASQQRCTNSP